MTTNQTNNTLITHSPVPTHLPNGHKILALHFEPTSPNEIGVVLGHSEGAVQPYATWRFYNGGLASTAYGHYFKDYESAYADYLNRIAE